MYNSYRRMKCLHPILMGDETEEFTALVTVHRLHVNELNDQFIEAVQAFFKDREVEITVCTSPPSTIHSVVAKRSMK